ncbi:hypothetical protein A2422_03475 [Candidatus Woesebacteria bacterium RIFOXYC1_FULL_31_51]|uniref:Endolytic murein transglycosylase n=1 Tax=Candidatus Woesebacteria bacterium GW2011_GWC2_31_9 TaxID=1618586 RepID=A0A0G0BJP1_9BACT|nr:MAG: periplasmic solute-binding protein, UPF0755 protein [Candidatus Woesebacteria bacterium GW2011_GWF1_31_35]KKP23302.1 MAG: hypothetical protein UR11_C0001G0276 [Candidatus Woesebacteria bacterium GW2011_GWC1_30_29]KKP26180.1 MAG: hypothetical protein UR13_C0005G0063 [Candidatus Woesebacteria bacterium GW2011_GWD1_31_12]KKP27563.1 MAG: hypothetical protein UR16_C0003G0223 [Candidatus Woesebacteria bacterium GW2011_GWB1_31_29]KKP31262.1 MAG: hypothetical protein UR21_C0012G0003 [Candidatus
MFKKIIYLLFFALSLFVVGIIFVKQMFLPVSTDKTQVNFLITKGSSVSLIGNDLYKQGFIKNPIVFKFYVQLTGSQNKIQAGEFSLSKNLTLIEILETLKKGPAEIWVTIPEGLRREEISQKFASSLSKNSDFMKEFNSLTIGKEGYLFPDTYLFSKSASSSAIVAKMLSTFDKKVSDVTLEQLIMASLIERETLGDDEKPIVAGILYKRIDAGWPLQVDATVQYAKANIECKNKIIDCKYWGDVFNLDKEINSTYNTYKNLGLPPLPIANPGLSSINASINPEKSDFWYYIHDGKGVIHYAKNLEEHNANVRKYLN